MSASVEDLDGPLHIWPIMVEAVAEYVVWIEADTEAEALDIAKNDGDLYERLGTSTNGWMNVDTPFSVYDWDHGNPIGPREDCPTCGVLPLATNWYHKLDCPRYPSKET